MQIINYNYNITHITTIFEAIREDRRGEQSLPLPNTLPWGIYEWNFGRALSVSKDREPWETWEKL